MKTFIHLEDANCPMCLDQVADELRSRPLVDHVAVSSTGHCIEVEHRDDDVDSILAAVRRSLHGFVAADNGETIQVNAGAELSHVCDAHR